MENELIQNLKATRTRLGLSQQQLAEAAGVTRQTISGIEAGQYAPSATVALRLAKALGCRVEDLFWLAESVPTLEATPAATDDALPNPVRVTLAQVQGRWLAYPLTEARAFREEMIPADGLGAFSTEREGLTVRLLDDPENLARTVVIAGCTPALSLWARSAERWHPGLRVHWTHANSMEALHRLANGEVHAAGCHLFDPDTQEFNAPFVRKILPGRSVVLVNLGLWEEGFLVASGNPKALRSAADLMRPEVTLANREAGAGARLLLDTTLRNEGVSPDRINGYGSVYGSHQEVARAVRSGQADIGISAASVAALYGLDFVPIRAVRYDLALLEETLQYEPVRQLLGTLHHRWIRAQLEALGGYDAAQMGEIVARL